MDWSDVDDILYDGKKEDIKKLKCPDYDKKTFIWKQHSSGTFYMECSNCGSIATVDLNTSCEQDSLFWKKTEIVVEPMSEKPSNRMMLDLPSTGIILLREIDPAFSTPASENMVYQNFPAIIFGFPMMFLAAFSPVNPLLTLIILLAMFLVMNLILFRSRIFRKKVM